jgi:hypothetical protein
MSIGLALVRVVGTVDTAIGDRDVVEAATPTRRGRLG